MRVNVITKGLMASVVLAIFVSAPLAAQMDDKQAMVDLVLQIQQLQDEVRMLRGMLEEQAIDLENLGKRQRDQYLDLDQRITELRGLTPDSSATRGPRTTVKRETSTAVPELGRTSGVLPEEVPEVRPAMDTPSSVTAIDTPMTEAREIAASPENEKTSYDQAFQSLKDLKYADAAEQFLDFIEKYPNSEYADNAQYWLG